MNAKEYYTTWINQQSKEFINSKTWPIEKVIEFAEEYKNGKFLNEEVLAEKNCPRCEVKSCYIFTNITKGTKKCNHCGCEWKI